MQGYYLNSLKESFMQTYLGKELSGQREKSRIMKQFPFKRNLFAME